MKLRRIILIVIAIAIISIIFASVSQAKTATVNVETLNLRKEASTSSTVLELLDRGDKLEIIEESGSWLKVKVKGITGYVSKEYVKMNDEEITNTEKKNEVVQNIEVENKIAENVEKLSEEKITNEIIEETTKTAVETEKETYKAKEATLNADSKLSILPLINATKIADVKNGEKVTIIDETKGWLYIQTEVLNGWVRKEVIKVEEVDTSKESENSKEPVKNDEKDENTQKEDNNKNNEQATNTNTSENTNEIKETQVTEKTMYVNYSSIYVRKGPGTNYEVVDSLILNDDVIVTAESGDWYKVKVGNITGYIAKRLLSNTKQETTSRGADERQTENDTQNTTVKENVESKQTSKESTTTESVNTTEKVETQTASSKGQEIVDYAKKYLGCKYVYGGSGPSTFDCSGFTMYVYKHFGVSLSHSATAQSKKGTYVAKENLQPGDLVFFTDYETNVGIGHCGIYIGNGNFIHASSGTGYCVKISDLTSGSYKKRYETARRIF